MKIKLHHIVLALSLCLLTITFALASGATAKLSWVAPTAYSDGSPVPLTDIDHYTVTWGPAAGNSGPSGSINIAGTLTSTPVPVPCGSTQFTITITTSANAKYPNATSFPTSPVPYASGIACIPNPPSGLVAQ